MRKSILMGTKEDVSRLCNRNEASKRSLHVSEACINNAAGNMPSTTKPRIVTFNHPILGN